MFFTSWSYFLEYLLSFKLLFTVLKENRFLEIFKISDKIDHEKFVIHTFVLETFYENKMSQKLNDILEFYKNWLLVYT